MIQVMRNKASITHYSDRRSYIFFELVLMFPSKMDCIWADTSKMQFSYAQYWMGNYAKFDGYELKWPGY